MGKMKSLRLREVKALRHRHIARMWQSQAQTQAFLTPKPSLDHGLLKIMPLSNLRDYTLPAALQDAGRIAAVHIGLPHPLICFFSLPERDTAFSVKSVHMRDP